MNYTVHKAFQKDKQVLTSYIENYETSGEDFGNQDRNSLKLYNLNGLTINVKSFKIPNLVNQIAYRFFRKSKAQRSFEYANRLLHLGIGTPQPIAFYEYKTPFLFKKSYYISEHLPYDLTYRELTFNLTMANHEAILRAFTRFTFGLHKAGVNFLDHSPGNTLIQLNGGAYKFYLVDLNRMEFGDMDFETRIKNFARLTTHKSMVEIMSDEYAKLGGYDYNRVFHLMWEETEAFQNRFHRKRRIKNKVFFWRKK
ncbi:MULTISPECIES: lipopolysaccharide kinase InaA family protein [unclassified Bizionia]|uniref:lipopolysaccharide kinase InaA family protein n=1 Tax=unclassified Bizionia TaxID=2626393 RepID=UPI00205F7E26|nr:lipopolysaccharide kinase InaA family protein [Bizionia sp. M204]UPS90554.1 Kdo domain containing protein [Bizionia sp. M204]